MANITRKERFARNFGQAVRATREGKGLSLADLTDECGVDMANISKVERGVVVPRLDNAVKIAKGLGVPLEALIP